MPWQCKNTVTALPRGFSFIAQRLCSHSRCFSDVIEVRHSVIVIVEVFVSETEALTAASHAGHRDYKHQSLQELNPRGRSSQRARRPADAPHRPHTSPPLSIRSCSPHAQTHNTQHVCVCFT